MSNTAQRAPTGGHHLAFFCLLCFVLDLRLSSDNACKAEFANDLLIWSSGSNRNDMATKLNQMMKELWTVSTAYSSYQLQRLW